VASNQPNFVSQFCFPSKIVPKVETISAIRLVVRTRRQQVVGGPERATSRGRVPGTRRRESEEAIAML